MPNQGAGNRGALMGWARAQVSFGPGVRTAWGAEVAPPNVASLPPLPMVGAKSMTGKGNEAPGSLPAGPQAPARAQCPHPSRTPSHSPTPQLRANRAKPIFFAGE